MIFTGRDAENRTRVTRTPCVHTTTVLHPVVYILYSKIIRNLRVMSHESYRFCTPCRYFASYFAKYQARSCGGALARPHPMRAYYHCTPPRRGKLHPVVCIVYADYFLLSTRLTASMIPFLFKP